MLEKAFYFIIGSYYSSNASQIIGKITFHPFFKFAEWLLIKYAKLPIIYSFIPNNFVELKIYYNGFIYYFWYPIKSFFLRNLVISCFKKSVPNKAVFSLLDLPSSI
jgi:hypothetical protein